MIREFVRTISNASIGNRQYSSERTDDEGSLPEETNPDQDDSNEALKDDTGDGAVSYSAGADPIHSSYISI